VSINKEEHGDRNEEQRSTASNQQDRFFGIDLKHDDILLYG
jgi:hypothetical protein